jgi:hypothetical protein
MNNIQEQASEYEEIVYFLLNAHKLVEVVSG